MRRALATLIALCLLFGGASASAFREHGRAPLAGWLNQRMALRTGPNTGYSEMFTLPQSTSIALYEREMGNGVDWVQVEFEWNGELYRGYTGMKRIESYEVVPWIEADPVETHMTASATPRFGPGFEYASHKDAIRINTPVTAYYSENGYAMIDFKDSGGQLTRAWVRSSALEGGLSGGDDFGDGSVAVSPFLYQREGARANQTLSLRTGPNTAYTSMGTMPKSTAISVYYQTGGNGVMWGYVQYEHKGELYRGYTGMKRIDANYDVPSCAEYGEEAHTARKVWLRYGPGALYAVQPGGVPAGATVRAYFYDAGYVMVDYQKGDKIQRGWIPEEDLAEPCFYCAY